MAYVVVRKDLTVELLNQKETFINNQQDIALWRETSDPEWGMVNTVIQSGRADDMKGLALMLLGVRHDAYAAGKNSNFDGDLPQDGMIMY